MLQVSWQNRIMRCNEFWRCQMKFLSREAIHVSTPKLSGDFGISRECSLDPGPCRKASTTLAGLDPPFYPILPANRSLTSPNLTSFFFLFSSPDSLSSQFPRSYSCQLKGLCRVLSWSSSRIITPSPAGSSAPFIDSDRR